MTSVDPTSERKTQTQLRAEQKKAAKLQHALDVVAKAENDDYGDGDFSGNTWSHDLGASKDVYIGDLCLDLEGHELLTFTELRLFHGHRYGLVGRNGVGKTTLLRRLALKKIAKFPSHIRCYLVKQEATASDLSAVQYVIASDTEMAALQAEEQKLLKQIEQLESTQGKGKHSAEENKLTARLNEVYASLESMEAGTARERATELLRGLQFQEAMMQAPVSSLSGGWRMRLALACGLFIRPDYLLLDEPTNHLDLHAVLWLQDYLANWDGSLLLVSHDRAFLNAVCTDIIHFTNKGLRYYQGDYDMFERQRTERLAKLQAIQDTLDTKRDAIKESMEKMKQRVANTKKGADDKRLKQVSSRRKKMVRMGAEHTLDGKKFNAQTHGIRLGSMAAKAGGYRDGSSDSLVEAPEPKVKFELLDPDDEVGTKGPLLTLKDVAFRWPEAKSPLITNVNLEITADSRLALLGANGSGKTTLLKIILGELQPTSGERWSHGNARLAHFTQTHVEQLDLKLTALEQVQARFPQFKEHECRAALARVGLNGDKATQIIATMSGGQKSRVAFALIAISRPHIMVLDEPTNHLDQDTIQALIEALRGYKGAVLLVSHDQSLITGVSKHMFMVGKQAVRRLDGSFDTYRRKLLEHLRHRAQTQARATANPPVSSSSSSSSSASAPAVSPADTSSAPSSSSASSSSTVDPTSGSQFQPGSKPRKGKAKGKDLEKAREEELEARRLREQQRLAMLF